MAKVSFEPRYALPILADPDPDQLREVLIARTPPGRDWGEALLNYHGDEPRRSMIVLADPDLGYYLKYIESSGDEWLSLGDRSRLDKVIRPDDWDVSVGLFVKPELAWHVVVAFCQSGARSTAITWLRPGDIPATGNY
jgi:hypothetical protein